MKFSLRMIATGLACLVLSAGTALATTDKVRETKLPNGLVVHEYKMHNGLQILLVPDHSAPVFTYSVWFKVGAMTEKLDPKLKRTGLAHLFEHMTFRGTPKYPENSFNAKLTESGVGDMNATTWNDRTNYYESLPKEHLELVFDLESERMTELKLDEKLFKTELGAVVGEYNISRDRPTRIGDELLWNTAFDTHPYKWSTIGTLEELHSFTVQEGQYFYKKYYAPNNATLIIIGDFQIPQALALAEKYYGPKKSQAIPEQKAEPEAIQKAARRAETSHHMANNEILWVGYKSVGIMHPDMAALETIGAVLGYGDGSLFNQNLIEKGLASSISADVYKFRDPGLFIIETQIVPGKSEETVRRAIEEQLARLREGRLTQAELDRGRNQYLLAAYSKLNTQYNIGDTLGEALVSGDDYLRNFKILEEIKKVSLADVKRIAQKYFRDEISTTVLLRPGKGGSK